MLRLKKKINDNLGREQLNAYESYSFGEKGLRENYIIVS